MSGAKRTITSTGRTASTSRSMITAASSRGTKRCCLTVNASCAYSIVTPSGRSITRRAIRCPAIGSTYFGTWNESSRSCNHLIGHDHSSSRPSSVPIAIARRPTAEMKLPGRASPVRRTGESPSGKYGTLARVESVRGCGACAVAAVTVVAKSSACMALIMARNMAALVTLVSPSSFRAARPPLIIDGGFAHWIQIPYP